MQAHLAFCCKALLPILGMGHVRVNLDKHERGRPLVNATRFLAKQPGTASHLELRSWDGCRGKGRPSTRHLIDLRCAHAPMRCWFFMDVAPALAMPGQYSTGDGTGADAAVRFRSLLTNLSKLTLHGVAISLLALQPIATRLRELAIDNSRLQGSADGFFTKGWTALTSLSLTHSRVEAASLAAMLNLPALENMNVIFFRHQGGVLQLDQLISGCPQLRRLRLQLSSDSAQGREGSGSCCSLQKLGRLADLYIWVMTKPLHASLDLDLPASLTRLEVMGAEEGDSTVDFFWVLSQAVKCIRRGAQLRSMTCRYTEADLQPAQWGASLDEQYRRLGGQLSSLTELVVWGGTERLLSALCAVISSAPHLTCVHFTTMKWLPRMEFSPICSASLESFTVAVRGPSNEVMAPPLVLTFLPGCTRLQEVLVQLPNKYLTEGTGAKIRCHPCSPTCIVPMDVLARAEEHRRMYGCARLSEVGIQFLPGPPSPQGVQRAYTVLYTCHAAGPQQPLMWGHIVVPGLL